MPALVVVSEPEDWSIEMRGATVVTARDYLTQPRFSESRGWKVHNLCRSYRYQSAGYYVSLLAAARGHKPMPSITTIQDMKSVSLARAATWDLDEQIQKSLAPITADRFTLSIYFGRNFAQRYQRLSLALFNLFPAPLLRAQFKHESDEWRLQSISPISAEDVPDEHWPFVFESAAVYFERGVPTSRRTKAARYDLAILHNPDQRDSPSGPKTLQKFVRAAEALGMRAELITRDDYGRLAEFDALFIRETTFPNHYTYRFARRAAAEGLVVMDDPDSIVKCTNKVYLAELMNRHKAPTPKTLIVHRDNIDEVAPALGMPCVLKQPDSSFSQGVVKVKDEEELRKQVGLLLESTELLIAQEFVPTKFDWRIGVLDRKPFYACRYYMAGKHWQIINQERHEHGRYGRVETIPVENAPPRVVRLAVRAANLIGDGFYGVDIKERAGRCYVIEVNDNPNVDIGYEDAVLKKELYHRVMEVFLRRIEERKNGRGTGERASHAATL